MGTGALHPHRWKRLAPLETAFTTTKVSRALAVGDWNRVGSREVRSGGSLLAQHDLRLHFGLGTCTGPLTAEVRWPDGTRQQLRFEELDAYLEVRYAAGG